jgi:hypothetical protein
MHPGREYGYSIGWVAICALQQRFAIAFGIAKPITSSLTDFINSAQVVATAGLLGWLR